MGCNAKRLRSPVQLKADCLPAYGHLLMHCIMFGGVRGCFGQERGTGKDKDVGSMGFSLSQSRTSSKGLTINLGARQLLSLTHHLSAEL